MMAVKNTRRIISAIAITCALGSPAMAQVAAAPVPTTSANAPAPSATKAAPAASGSSMKIPAADEFKTESGAKTHCPSDTVVWSTLSKSKAFHLATSTHYGKTKHGAYVCEKDATMAGFHQAKN